VGSKIGLVVGVQVVKSLGNIGGAYLCPPSTGLPDCFRLVSLPFIVEVALVAGLPPVFDCVEAVVVLLPEAPFAAGAAVVVEVMTSRPSHDAGESSGRGLSTPPLGGSVNEIHGEREEKGGGKVSRTTSIGEEVTREEERSEGEREGWFLVSRT